MKQDYIQEFIKIIARLRAPNGCPWDQEQTHASIKSCLIEECAELLDAIDDNDSEAMLEELGDILLQVIFHSQIASEENRFNIQDVAKHTCEKLIRRHPHVFADSIANNPEAVLQQWEKIKKTEKASANRTSAISGVPRHLPALQRAEKLQKKATKVGFDWDTVKGVIDKIEEELNEVKEAIANKNQENIKEEIGDLLFAVVNLARFQKLHPEELLHATIKKFTNRFIIMEKLLKNKNKNIETATLCEMEQSWQEAKKEEKTK